MSQNYEHRPSLIHSLYQDLDMMINEFSNSSSSSSSADQGFSLYPPPEQHSHHVVARYDNNESSDDNDTVPSTPSLQNTTATTATPRLPPSPPHEKDHHDPVGRLPSQRSTNSDVPTIQELESSNNFALLSTLASEFVRHVQELNRIRRLYCSDEYPLCFTGEEAMRIMKAIVPFDLKDGQYKEVARLFMHTSPPFIAPTSYAEKSLRKNKLYTTASEIYTLIASEEDEERYPHGVYTPFSSCYSQTCTAGSIGCYSLSCPNRLKRTSSMESDEQQPVQRTKSNTSSSVASSYDTAFSKAWQASVPAAIIKDTPKKEIQRQEAIYELIYTEDNYVRDLCLLDEIYARTLRSAQCIDEERRDTFCDNVFSNYQELLMMHKSLFREMHDYQTLCQVRSPGGFVDRIGNIMLRYVDRFMKAYTRYGPHVPVAEYLVKRETSNNILFHNFVREREKQAECRKLGFRHFLVTPVSRLQRYPLLIKAILDKTPENHPDRQDLVRCDEIIKSVCVRTDDLTKETRMKLAIYKVDDSLQFKPGASFVDLRLREKGRQLLHSGVVKRRIYMEEKEHHLHLFDHVLLITKPKDNIHFVWRRPIPLELLTVRDHASSVSSTSQRTTWSSSYHSTAPLSPPVTTPPILSTLIIRHLGNKEGDYVFHVPDVQTRNEWKTKIMEAKEAFEKAHPERKVFNIKTLSDTTFTKASGPASNGKVTCSASFVGAQGQRMVAIGTEQGVWMGTEGSSSLTKVLNTASITQLAVLQDYHILLVLADKVLMAYPLDALDPTSTTPSLKSRQKLPSFQLAKSVSFFEAGVCDRRVIVVVKKKKGVDSVFTALEPVCGDLRDSRNAKYLNTKSGLLSRAPSWFKSYRDFYIGAGSSAIHILNKRLAIVCERGFEIISLDTLRNHPLPDLDDPDFQFVQKRQDQLIPLGMFRCQSNYLLCYNEFAFLVDMKGRYIRGQPRIEWHGTPRSVAFCYPYVIGFDPNFIEVRHAETSELIQVLEGEDMRILYSKSGIGASAMVHGCMTHSFKPDYHYVFSLTPAFQSTA
ncbi:hypothetical protein LRAMOSA07786 [Lichtheimia ramosa]|uniref:DH domain-containing protein n=1 Tax=Lichtheimia ramosa TaxID=688394 RepID=A0A077WF31_9FUNG|nr:hypothetical protein LRAMOSA07786 [Lichtheimia ramosa]